MILEQEANIELLKPIGEWFIDPGLYLLREILRSSGETSLNKLIELLNDINIKNRIISGILSIPNSTSEFAKYLPNGLIGHPSNKMQRYDKLEIKKSLKQQFIENILKFSKEARKREKIKKELESKIENSSLIFLLNFFKTYSKKDLKENPDIFNFKVLKSKYEEINDEINKLAENRSISLKEEKYQDLLQKLYPSEYNSLGESQRERLILILKNTHKFRDSYSNWEKDLKEKKIEKIFKQRPNLEKVFAAWKKWTNDNRDMLKVKLLNFYNEMLEELRRNNNNSDINRKKCWICSKIYSSGKLRGRAIYPFLGAERIFCFYSMGDSGQRICFFCQFLAILSYFSFFKIRIQKGAPNQLVVMKASDENINKTMAKISLERFNNFNFGIKQYLGNSYQSIYEVIIKILERTQFELNEEKINDWEPNMSLLIFYCDNQPIKVRFKRFDFPNPTLRFLRKLRKKNLLNTFKNEIVSRNIYVKNGNNIEEHLMNLSQNNSNIVYSIRNKMIEALLQEDSQKVIKLMTYKKRIINKDILEDYIRVGLKMKPSRLRLIKEFSNAIKELLNQEESKERKKKIYNYFKKKTWFAFLEFFVYLQKRAIFKDVETLKNLTPDLLMNNLFEPVSASVPNDWKTIFSLIQISVLEKTIEIFKDCMDSKNQ